MPEQQHDPRARADAADAHDLACGVCVAETPEQAAPIATQGARIVPDESAREQLDGVVGRLARELFDRDDQRRIADDSRRPIDLVGELRERTQVVARTGLRNVLLEQPHAPRRGLLATHREDLLDVEARVPAVEHAHRRKSPHRAAIGGRRREVDVAPCPAVESPLAPGHREARGQALEIPLERAGKRLVEVVHPEHEAPIGRCEDAEVRQVGVAAELRLQPGARQGSKIGCHDVRRTAEERERRDEHPAVANRHELWHTCR